MKGALEPSPTNPVEEPTAAPDEPTAEAVIAVMNALHVEIGKTAAELALKVLESANVADIPIPAAVSLLKFGVDLQRKALLGAEDAGDAPDPFADLAKTLVNTGTPRKEG